MSFASEVKKELTTLEVHREHAKAELTALIRMSGSVSIYNQAFVLNVQTENAAIARRMYVLLKDHYSFESELLVRRKMKLKKNNVYIVRLKQGVRELLSDLNIFDGLSFKTQVSEDIMNNNQKERSYLRGAFMAGGSVNSPETSRYHLEIYSNYEDHNQDICDMMNHFDLNARTIERRNGFITYLKEAEKIADFLALIGAHNAMMKFEDVRIIRDMRNSVNRVVEGGEGNVKRTIGGAAREVGESELIEGTVGREKVPEKRKGIGVIRVGNRDSSVEELGEMIRGGVISKSGINHRLRKINDFADSLRMRKTIR